MNTGIGDAINLAWKLEMRCWPAAPPDALLDSYEPERIAFARKLVATTDRAFTIATADGPIADFLRTKVLRRGAAGGGRISPPSANSCSAPSHRPCSTTGAMPLSEGKAGAVHGGDRLPWIREASENYKSLSQMIWQVHVYGTALPGLRAAAARSGCRCRFSPGREPTSQQACAADACYLMRPESYVALA